MNNENQAVIDILLKLDEHISTMQVNLESRLDKVESRLDKIESRLDKVESRLDKIESRLDKVEARLDKVEASISANTCAIMELRCDMTLEFKAVRSDLDAVNKLLTHRIDTVETVTSQNCYDIANLRANHA